MPNKRLLTGLSLLLTGILLMTLLLSAPALAEGVTEIVPTHETVQLEKGFSVVRLDGEDWLEDFLAQGGAESDTGVVTFLGKKLLFGQHDLQLDLPGFGCSSLSVSAPDGDALFGRNFDWYSCETLIVENHPATGYASVSTVNLDFLSVAKALPDSALNLAALYAGLDGMNECGLCAAVLYIQGIKAIDQQSSRPDLTTTTLIRLLLNKAANVDEALALLEQYDFHASFGMSVHFALSDADGRSVAVEYINGEMLVTETPALTNFVIADCAEHGTGTAQSVTRYEILTQQLADTPVMDENGVQAAMQSVDKSHWYDGEATEWTMVCNKTEKTVTYYHRQDYTHGWTIRLVE